MVYRVFVEKKEELANEAKALLSDARNLLGITNLKKVRVINRYDAENISEELFEYAKKTVFSEPQLDKVSEEMKLYLNFAKNLKIPQLHITKEEVDEEIAIYERRNKHEA